MRSGEIRQHYTHVLLRSAQYDNATCTAPASYYEEAGEEANTLWTEYEKKVLRLAVYNKRNSINIIQSARSATVRGHLTSPWSSSRWPLSLLLCPLSCSKPQGQPFIKAGQSIAHSGRRLGARNPETHLLPHAGVISDPRQYDRKGETRLKCLTPGVGPLTHRLPARPADRRSPPGRVGWATRGGGGQRFMTFQWAIIEERLLQEAGISRAFRGA